MKIEYDPTADALYVRLSDQSIIESEQIKPGIVLDYDDAGNVVGIEVLRVSKHDSSPLKQAA
ncbi:MAG: DUF2283 domain-containing protein [Propionivibrio sp.]|nr:DUF2283 domain-containing protein [Propionivibrio sp.]MBP6711105.1 DUF2283 domain-containing protein [Propionivibrio sp.]MBP7523326.1 DUF2283 domain-containing protein [Propionivibrio sp.]MBP8162066.1 DUF2283 domain-containing protein [Propionivibrio sp.]